MLKKVLATCRSDERDGVLLPMSIHDFGLREVDAYPDSFTFSFSLFVSRKSRSSCVTSNKACPLLVVESNGKTAKTIQTDAALLAHFEPQAATWLLLFKFRHSRLQFLIRWFRHLIHLACVGFCLDE